MELCLGFGMSASPGGRRPEGLAAKPAKALINFLRV